LSDIFVKIATVIHRDESFRAREINLVVGHLICFIKRLQLIVPQAFRHSRALWLVLGDV
jgi:hypothetical protein